MEYRLHAPRLFSRLYTYICLLRRKKIRRRRPHRNSVCARSTQPHWKNMPPPHECEAGRGQGLRRPTLPDWTGDATTTIAPRRGASAAWPVSDADDGRLGLCCWSVFASVGPAMSVFSDLLVRDEAPYKVPNGYGCKVIKGLKPAPRPTNLASWLWTCRAGISPQARHAFSTQVEANFTAYPEPIRTTA